MKKLIVFFCILAFSCFPGISNALTTSSGYLDPVIYQNLNFSAELDISGNVDTSWEEYTDNLMYYKVIRSETNSNPVYPEDGYIFYSSNVTSYTDTNVPYGTSYYRVCAITYAKERFCSSVITINKSSTYEQDTTNPTNISLKSSTIDGKVKLFWSLDGSSLQGYKIAKSKTNTEPTYPPLSGDSAYYISNPSTKYYTDSAVEPETKYYYRVCIYDGSACSIYSNAISVEVPYLPEYTQATNISLAG